MLCDICGKNYIGSMGNNALPIKDGRCCNECYMIKVIPARIKLGKQIVSKFKK